jgi:hypothetical protein
VELFVIKNYGCGGWSFHKHDQGLHQTTHCGELVYVHRQAILLTSCYSVSKPLNNATECGVMWQISFGVLSLKIWRNFALFSPVAT